MAKTKLSDRSWAFAIFLSLVFIVSWGAILALVGPDGLPATTEDIGILVIAMLLGPSVAGIVAIGVISGKRGYQTFATRLTRWRVGFRWYGVALAIAPASTLLSLAILSFFTSDIRPAFATTDEVATLLVMWIVGGIVVALFEEIGWTGFAVPQLRINRSAFATGLIVGVMWGAWHFLVNWQTDSFSGIVPFSLLLARLFTWIIAYRILMVWIYERTNSLFIVILMHFSLVVTTGVLDPVLDGGSLLVFLLVKAAVLWMFVLSVFRQMQHDKLVGSGG